MHFTINKDYFQQGDPTGNGKQYVVGHSLGEGWTRHIVELGEGDTADNPSSTKGPLYGPAFVVYDVARTGITTHVHNNASEFYDALQPNQQLLMAAVAVLDSEYGVQSVRELAEIVKAQGGGDFTEQEAAS